MAHTFKVHILKSERDVGASNLIRMLCNESFKDGYHPLEVAFKIARVDVKVTHINLQLWESEAGGGSQSGYYRGPHAILIICNLTDADSYNKLEAAITKNASYTSGDQVVTILVGTKSDLKAKRVVEDADLLKLQKTLSLDGMVLVSAKTGDNIDELRQAVVKTILKKQNIVLKEPTPAPVNVPNATNPSGCYVM